MEHNSIDEEQSPNSSDISFFKLAQRYEMPSGRRRRWREQRDTLPARRRRRRTRRRDLRASREYLPMEVDANSASRGIQTRLVGAMASALVTVVCVLSIFLAPQITLAAVFPLTIGIGSLGLSIALTMSARREEIVHEAAGRLIAELDEIKPALPPATNGDLDGEPPYVDDSGDLVGEAGLIYDYDKSDPIREL